MPSSAGLSRAPRGPCRAPRGFAPSPGSGWPRSPSDQGRTNLGDTQVLGLCVLLRSTRGVGRYRPSPSLFIVKCEFIAIRHERGDTERAPRPRRGSRHRSPRSPGTARAFPEPQAPRSVRWGQSSVPSLRAPRRPPGRGSAPPAARPAPPAAPRRRRCGSAAAAAGAPAAPAASLGSPGPAGRRRGQLSPLEPSLDPPVPFVPPLSPRPLSGHPEPLAGPVIPVSPRSSCPLPFPPCPSDPPGRSRSFLSPSVPLSPLRCP